MTSTTESQRDHTVRSIAQRIVIRGTLELTAPAHFGGGVESDLADMALLRDTSSGGLLLPGTSLAGALRSYLRAYQYGHYAEEQGGGLAELLLGGQQSDPDGAQSPLLVADSLAKPTLIEVRDGVAIEPKTRTARDQKKFNLELAPVGTCFPLEFELILPADEAVATQLRFALALALDALQHGDITLGARSSRGYGTCQVQGWSVTTYDLADSKHLLAYLAADAAAAEGDAQQQAWQVYATAPVAQSNEDKDIVALLQPTIPLLVPDQRNTVTLRASFDLASPLLIRSDLPEFDGEAPDATQLRRYNGSQTEPVLPGTSLAGALRARATRIVNTLGAKHLRSIEELFGPEQGGDVGKRTLRASRLRVSEQAISGAASLVQSRVSIDRFTGGALDTALFSEAPLIRGDLALTISLYDPGEPEIGLLLLLLKDLWTGDLPLGGTSSVGRGRLRGLSAELHFSPQALPKALQPTDGIDPQLCWPIGDKERLSLAPQLASYLEACVQQIPAWLQQEQKRD